MPNLNFFPFIRYGVAKPNPAAVSQVIKQTVARQNKQRATNTNEIETALSQLGQQHLFTAPISAKACPDNRFSVKDFHHLKVLLARSSGSLASLSGQNFSAARWIIASDNDVIKKSRLAKMSVGKHLIGIAPSLRLAEPQKAMIHATKRGDDYYIQKATLPFCIGYLYFNELIINFVADNQEITALIPFEVRLQPPKYGYLTWDKCLDVFSLPMIAGSAVTTATLKMDDLFIPERLVLTKKTLGSFSHNDLMSTDLESYILGLIENLLNLMKENVLANHYLQSYKALAAEYERKILDMAVNKSDASVLASGIKLFDEMLTMLKLLPNNVWLSEQLKQLDEECNLHVISYIGDKLLIATLSTQENFPQWGRAKEININKLGNLKLIIDAVFSLLQQAPQTQECLRVYQYKYEKLANADISSYERAYYGIKLYNELHALIRVVFREKMVLANDPVSIKIKKTHNEFNEYLQGIAQSISFNVFFDLTQHDIVKAQLGNQAPLALRV